MDKQWDIVGIGVSVLDVVLVVDELPAEETVVRARGRRIGLGGAIAVAVATAGRLGGRVAFADSLGFDPMSDSILATLRSAMVDVTHVRQSVEQAASVATVLVSASSGSRTIVFAPGDGAELECSIELDQLVAASRILHLNGRHLSASLRATEVARSSGSQVSFDGGAHRYRQQVLPLVRASDILIVSEQFAQACRQDLSSDSSVGQPSELVSFLRSQFDAKLVAVTCGERGSWIGLRDGSLWHEPAVTVEAVRDTTGCGDTYHGAFLLALARGLAPVECGRIASTVAARNAQHLGALGFQTDQLLDELAGQIPRDGLIRMSSLWFQK